MNGLTSRVAAGGIGIEGKDFSVKQAKKPVKSCG